MLKKELRELSFPDRMKRLPLDARGFPIPWFVHVTKGVPDFRVVRPGGVVTAFRSKTCWLCGERLGSFYAFNIGPMCAVNRVNSEPPSHRDCAVFAAQACPFLNNPRMRRNEKDLPEDRIAPGGIHIPRNPGVACVWITRSFRPFRATGGTLFELGDPVKVMWFAEGRTATRDEVVASIESGMPLLERLAEVGGSDDVALLHSMLVKLQKVLPPLQGMAA